MSRLLIYILLLIGSITLTRSTGDQILFYFPDENWDHLDDPKLHGWKTTQLQELGIFLRDSCHTTGMMVVHHGKVVFEYGNVNEVSYIASCRKSVLAMLYGPFIQGGAINLATTLGDLGLDDIQGLLEIEKKATIKDLLTARSGVYHPASNEGDQSSMAPGRGTVVPGSCWLYNNWDFNIAGHILEMMTKTDIYDLIDSMIARPLQMEDWNKQFQMKTGDSTKSQYLAYHMWFSTRDMARIGYLMLREGRWRNKEILPNHWIETITAPVTSYEEAFNNQRNYSYFGYGYMWWRWDRPNTGGKYSGWYTAMGAFGQYISVFPNLDLVVVHKNNSMNTFTSIETYLKIVDKIILANGS